MSAALVRGQVLFYVTRDMVQCLGLRIRRKLTYFLNCTGGVFRTKNGGNRSGDESSADPLHRYCAAPFFANTNIRGRMAYMRKELFSLCFLAAA